MDALLLQNLIGGNWRTIEVFYNMNAESLASAEPPDIFALLTNAFAKHCFHGPVFIRSNYRIIATSLIRMAMDHQAIRSPHVLLEPGLVADDDLIHTGFFNGVPIMLADIEDGYLTDH